MPERVFIALLLCISLFIPELDASERNPWRYLEIDNVRVVSNLSDRHLRRVNREVYYFNRALELTLGKEVLAEEPIDALIVRTEAELAEFIGNRAVVASGLWGGIPGLKLLMIQRAGSDHIEAPVFHELIHRHLDPKNVPLWFHEGMAELFETFYLRGKRGVIGRSHPASVRFLQAMPESFNTDYSHFFNLDSESSYYIDPEKHEAYYALAWIFAHYCWFGNPEYKSAYLELSQEKWIDESVFQRHFDFNYEELGERLRKYSQKRRYPHIEVDLSDFDSPPARIRDATPIEWRTLHARAYLTSNQLQKARQILHSLSSDDLAVADIRATLSILEGDDFFLDQNLALAYELGTENPAVLTRFVWRRLENKLNDSQNTVSNEEAQKWLTYLQPGLDAYWEHPNAVSAYIVIQDLQNKKFSPERLPAIRYWKNKHGHGNPYLVETIERLK